MRFMNEYDLEFARERFGSGQTPNRLALVITVDRLREWADTVSDGWSFWPKPSRAAVNAIELIDSRTYVENQRQEREDITEAEMLAAVQPIKSFLTKAAKEPHGGRRGGPMLTPEERELILRSTQPMFEAI